MTPPPLSCGFCGHRNPGGARFCNACGEPLHLVACPRCEAINDRAATRCHKCGAALAGAVTEPPAVTAPTPPGRAAPTGSSIARAFAPDAVRAGERAAAPAPGTPARSPARPDPAGARAQVPRADGIGVHTTRTPPDAWATAALATPGARKEPSIAAVEALTVPLTATSASHASARALWREPPRRRVAPLIFGLAGVAMLVAAFALQHYGLVAVHWPELRARLGRALGEAPAPAPQAIPPTPPAPAPGPATPPAVAPADVAPGPSPRATPDASPAPPPPGEREAAVPAPADAPAPPP